MDAFLSILMPVYNAEETLSPCLESILRQDHPRFEVVVVDDGSIDQTPEILKEFSQRDLRFRLIRFDRNRGIVAALNAGLEACRADWIVRMDADDRMKPHRLTTQLAYMEQYPETNILGAQVTIFRKDGELTPGQKNYRDWSNGLVTDAAIKANIFAESPIMHPTFFLKRSLYRELGGYLDNPWAEDYDFLLRAYLRGLTFAKVPEVLVEKWDSPTRLARVDKRCKRKAMFQAKAHYFARTGRLKAKKERVVIGSGNSGLLTRAALARENIPVTCFADNQRSSSPRTIKGLPAYYLDQSSPDSLFTRLDNPFFFISIGISEARRSVELLLEKQGFKQGDDFIRFI